jgi:Chromo (CHRromatin Organisation MOdifier) domain
MERKVTKGKEYFYIHWKGYPAKDDSWEPRENLSPETLAKWEKILHDKTKASKPQLLRFKSK